MAYMTQDRIARRVINPVWKESTFLLGDGEVIYANTLCGVLADGTVVNLAGNESDVVEIYFTEERLQAGLRYGNDQRTSDGLPYATNATVTYDRDVYLDHAGDIVAGSVGDVYLVDDHTVTLTDAGDGSTPEVGRIIRVFGNQVIVRVTGPLA